MNEPQWAGRSGTDLTSLISTTPQPATNDTCPECDIGITDGSAWRLEFDSHVPMRVHVACLTKRRIALNQDPGQDGDNDQNQDAEPSSGIILLADSDDQLVLSGLGLARACITQATSQAHTNPGTAILALAGAVNELVQYLQQKETP